MATPSPLEFGKEAISNVYDAYAKVVINNRGDNEARDYYRRNKRVFIPSEQQLVWFLNLPSDERFENAVMLQIKEVACKIQNEALYSALRSIDPNKALTLVLRFWYGYTDAQSARYLHVATRTICKWRNKALRDIRKLMRKREIKR